MENEVKNIGAESIQRDNFIEKQEIKKLPQSNISAHLPPADIEKVPQKRNILLIVLLSIITLGIYNSVWYLRRAPEFYNLGTNKKLSTTLGVTLLILNILFITILIILPLTITVNFEDMGVFLQNPTTFQSILVLALGIVILLSYFFMLLNAFYSRKIINQALEGKDSKTRVSGLFTFIFNLFYLQYEINKVVDDKEDEPKIGPWAFFTIFLTLIVLGIIYYFM